MLLNTREAMMKYGEHLRMIDDFRQKLVYEGFIIKAEDEFELGALWHISYNHQQIANFEWNVPHMLAFEPLISQLEEQFDIDYVKNVSDWSEFIDDVARSIISTKQSM